MIALLIQGTVIGSASKMMIAEEQIQPPLFSLSGRSRRHIRLIRVLCIS